MSQSPHLAASLCPEAWTFNFQDSNVAKAENCICSVSRTNLIWSWDLVPNLPANLLEHRHFPGSKVKWTSGKIKRPNLQVNTLMLVHSFVQSKANWFQLGYVSRILKVVIEILNLKNATNSIIFSSFLLPSYPSFCTWNAIRLLCQFLHQWLWLGQEEMNKSVCFKVPA